MLNILKEKQTGSFVYEHPPAPPRELREVEKAYARLFASADGKIVLGHLQSITFHRAHGATTGDEQLRYTEGQRALVASILRMIDRGRK